MLVKLGRPARYTMIPMVLITGAALAAALYQLLSLYREGGIFYFLLWIDVIIVILAIFVLLEAGSAFMRERRAAEAAAAGASA
jgi:carbon starvation protein